MTVSIGLAARNSIQTWVTGIVGCILFGFLFFESRLYADATLQLFFIAISAIGWWQWHHPRKPEQDAERRITKARPKTLFWMAVTALDGVVFCQPYFAFVQDGTRRDDRFRVEQHAWSRMKAGSMTCPVLDVGGDFSSRVSRVEEWLQELEIV